MSTEYNKKRLPWVEYFMSIAELTSCRSTCIRRKIGAVIVDTENRIISTGYNGIPSKLKHCDERGCLRAELDIPSAQRIEICRAMHAEQNAIIYARRDLNSCSIYVTHMPCATCAKMIISAGICKIFYKEPYPDEFTEGLLKEAEVKILQIC
jgi:dCMP deaminase